MRAFDIAMSSQRAKEVDGVDQSDLEITSVLLRVQCLNAEAFFPALCVRVGFYSTPISFS